MANTLKFGNGEWYGKKDTILAYNDENSNYKPLPFDFSRASSATVINKDGLIETVGSGQPRIDYKDDSKGALLLEPSRSNLVTKSENIQDWNRASNATAEFGYEDPFKGNKAVKLTSSSTAQSYQVYQSTGALSSGSTYTFSMYAKKGTGHIFRLDFGIPDNGFVHIDLRDGSLLQESGSTYYDGYKVEPMSNGWYRISIVSTFNSSAYYRAGLYQEQEDCYVAFAQLEQGSYATSYIPTQGSAVTRLADSCLQGSFQDKNIFGSTQGSVVLEFKWDIGLYVFDLSDALGVRLRIFDGGSNWKIRDFAGASWVNTGFAKSNNVKTKIAFKWNGTEFTTFQDGVKSSSTDSFASNMSIKSITTNKLNNTSNMQFYNTALTDQELIALTS